jgi:hypothetical protein
MNLAGGTTFGVEFSGGRSFAVFRRGGGFGSSSACPLKPWRLCWVGGAAFAVEFPGGRSFVDFEGAEGLVLPPLVLNSIDGVDAN